MLKKQEISQFSKALLWEKCLYVKLLYKINFSLKVIICLHSSATEFLLLYQTINLIL
jgi:hypothetical protein